MILLSVASINPNADAISFPVPSGYSLNILARFGEVLLVAEMDDNNILNANKSCLVAVDTSKPDFPVVSTLWLPLACGVMTRLTEYSGSLVISCQDPTGCGPGTGYSAFFEIIADDTHKLSVNRSTQIRIECWDMLIPYAPGNYIALFSGDAVYGLDLTTFTVSVKVNSSTEGTAGQFSTDSSFVVTSWWEFPSTWGWSKLAYPSLRLLNRTAEGDTTYLVFMWPNSPNGLGLLMHDIPYQQVMYSNFDFQRWIRGATLNDTSSMCDLGVTWAATGNCFYSIANLLGSYTQTITQIAFRSTDLAVAQKIEDQIQWGDNSNQLMNLLSSKDYLFALSDDGFVYRIAVSCPI